jgi:hypothetical protein
MYNSSSQGLPPGDQDLLQQPLRSTGTSTPMPASQPPVLNLSPIPQHPPTAFPNNAMPASQTPVMNLPQIPQRPATAFPNNAMPASQMPVMNLPQIPQRPPTAFPNNPMPASQMPSMNLPPMPQHPFSGFPNNSMFGSDSPLMNLPSLPQRPQSAFPSYQMLSQAPSASVGPFWQHLPSTSTNSPMVVNTPFLPPLPNFQTVIGVPNDPTNGNLISSFKGAFTFANFACNFALG